MNNQNSMKYLQTYILKTLSFQLKRNFFHQRMIDFVNILEFKDKRYKIIELLDMIIISESYYLPPVTLYHLEQIIN